MGVKRRASVGILAQDRKSEESKEGQGEGVQTWGVNKEWIHMKNVRDDFKLMCEVEGRRKVADGDMK